MMTQTMPISIDSLEPIALIGSGGFGRVWQAYQSSLDRMVAVKVGHVPLVDRLAWRRFEQECKALVRLSDHPGILDIYMSGVSSDGYPYLITEYLPCGTLECAASDMTELCLQRAGIELCEAIGAAHACNILHRDIKPGNVFLDSAGAVVVGDFGLAKLVDVDATVTNGVVATLAFAPPEILEGHAATEASDVYGIAVTIASALLGSSPFLCDGDNATAPIMRRVLNEAPAVLIESDVSAEFADLLIEAMSKDPARRPPTVVELRRRFEELEIPDQKAASPIDWSPIDWSPSASGGVSPIDWSPSASAGVSPTDWSSDAQPSEFVSGSELTTPLYTVQEPIGGHESGLERDVASGAGSRSDITGWQGQTLPEVGQAVDRKNVDPEASGPSTGRSSALVVADQATEAAQDGIAGPGGPLVQGGIAGLDGPLVQGGIASLDGIVSQDEIVVQGGLVAPDETAGQDEVVGEDINEDAVEPKGRIRGRKVPKVALGLLVVANVVLVSAWVFGGGLPFIFGAGNLDAGSGAHHRDERVRANSIVTFCDAQNATVAVEFTNPFPEHLGVARVDVVFIDSGNPSSRAVLPVEFTDVASGQTVTARVAGTPEAGPTGLDTCEIRRGFATEGPR